MAKTLRAYRITDKLFKRNSIPSYNDLADNVAQITPVKIRNIGSWNYHVAEDVKGQVYLIEDDLVTQYKLYERNMGVTETKFMLDGVGINQIKQYKESQSKEEEEVVVKEEEEKEEVKAVNVEVESEDKEEQQEIINQLKSRFEGKNLNLQGE